MKAATKNESARNEFYTELNILKAKFAVMQPELEVTLRDPDMGVEGYVVVWNTGISIGGPMERAGKGGMRITPNLSLDEVKMLARTMALKNAAAGLPLGGSKSGMKDDFHSPGHEKRFRRFVRMCAPFLHENGGPFGGFGFDVGAKPEHAIWACDELKSTRCFTGKPLSMGGTDYDREGIAGLGVAVAARTLLEVRNIDPAKTTYAVQGLGAMGAAVLRYFSETGTSLKILSDPKYGGTWSFDKPLSPALIEAIFRQDVEGAKSLMQREGRKISSSPEDALYADVDVLFPSAIQNVITDANADKIKAPTIVEAANSPVTETARTKLYDRGVVIVPDFIANPGGIIAAYVELTSSSNNKVEESKKLTREKIPENVRAMMTMADRYGVEPAHAALHMALSKIVPG